ncbi:DUF1616 domain-containing protein [Candidatus Bathyarchaeota archaeon A05DMB-2]|nr:DUF1616 domain-containing protein [Candidatus Bathyarchaeota archaeon A05DMB-2]
MTFTSYKALFIAVALVGSLLLSTPTLVLFMPWSGEAFSEIWVLGSSHTTSDYPFNVTAGEQYTIYLGVANHMAGTSYYTLKVKFRNQTDSYPDTDLGKASSLPTLNEYRIVIPDGGVWEKQLTLSFSNISTLGNRCVIQNLKINDLTFNVNKQAQWDSKNAGYYYQLLFELWIFNPSTQSFQYHNRYSAIWLNMTSPV